MTTTRGQFQNINKGNILLRMPLSMRMLIVDMFEATRPGRHLVANLPESVEHRSEIFKEFHNILMR